MQAVIPRPSLGNYEQGTYVPRDKSLEPLAAIFGVEPGYLRYGSPVITSNVWLPVIPTNARRKREIITDILNLMPDFIAENRFDSVLSRPLGEGARLFYFGRNNDFSCLLLASVDLAEPMRGTVRKIISIEELQEDSRVTIATFSVKDLDFQEKYSGHKGWKFDVEGMCHALEKRRGGAREIKKEPLSFILQSFLLVSREYDIPPEAVVSLTEFSIQKYAEVAPLPTRHINPITLMSEFREKIESLGGVRHIVKV